MAVPVQTGIRIAPDSTSGRFLAVSEIQRGSVSHEVQEVLASIQSDAVTIGVNVTTAPAQYLAANPLRRRLVVQNISDSWIYIRFSASPVATPGLETGIALGPYGGTHDSSTVVDARALNAIHGDPAGGTKRLLITEW